MSIRVAAVTLLQRYAANSSTSGAAIRHCNNSNTSYSNVNSSYCGDDNDNNLSYGHGHGPAARCMTRRTFAQESMVDHGRQHEDNIQHHHHHYNVHIVDAIMQDHMEMKSLYQKYALSSDPKEKAKCSNQWRWAVARHSIGEELMTYPVMEKYINGGDCIADKVRQQHQSVKDNLAELESVGMPKHPRFEPLMQQTQQALEKIMREEEDHYLPMLRNAIPEEEGRRLGGIFQLIKKFAPTHSHPNAPDKPPFETISGLMTAPLDNLRDMFDDFLTREEINKISKSN